MSTSIWVRGSAIDPHLIIARVMVLTTLPTTPFTLLNRRLTSTHLSILVTVLRAGWAGVGLCLLRALGHELLYWQVKWCMIARVRCKCVQMVDKT